MGCLYAFDNGEPMLRNISTPLLNALDDKQQGRHFQREFVLERLVSPGEKHNFWVSKWLHQEAKKGAFLNRWKEKCTPEIEHNSVYIYIYIIYIYIWLYIYIYISIYVYLHALWSWVLDHFGGFGRLGSGPELTARFWTKMILAYFCSGFGQFLCTKVSVASFFFSAHCFSTNVVKMAFFDGSEKITF